jgi:hypothetical protein
MSVFDWPHGLCCNFCFLLDGMVKRRAQKQLTNENCKASNSLETMNDQNERGLKVRD